MKKHSKVINKKKSLLFTFVKEWSFVVLFLVGCGVCHQLFSYNLKQDCGELSMELDQLKTEYAQAVKHHELLKLKINSQSDPYWIEMMLKKSLGVVPEGQIKVHFEDAES